MRREEALRETGLQTGDMIIANANDKGFPDPANEDIQRLMSATKRLDGTTYGFVGNLPEHAGALAARYGPWSRRCAWPALVLFPHQKILMQTRQAGA